ncbi:MAG: NAD(P)/FAD-dependent oxidoreductase [Bacteroidia bacterium]
MISFWENKNFLHFDVLVIGSGICGLSAACSIKEKNKNLNIAIIERGILPSGASTKNAGFACIGNPTEDLADLDLMGKESLIQLVSKRFSGLQILRNRLGDENIGYEATGSHEIIFHNQEFDESKIELLNQILFPVFDQPVFEKLPSHHSYFGFDKNKVQSIYKNNLDGQIDTGLMMDNFISYANSLGIRILTGTSVEAFEDLGNSIELSLKSEFQSIKIKTQKLAICTNAFSKKLIPEIDLQPGRGQVLITNEIEGLQLNGTYSFDEGYYYFRNVGKRVLFGGGRNLDFKTEESLEFELNPKIQNQLISHLKEWIIPQHDFTIERQWTGIMAFGGNKTPFIKRLSNNVVAGVRMNGMGVALSGKIGEELAEMLLN